MKLNRGENYNLAIGCAEPKEARYLGNRYSKKTNKDQVFIFIDDPIKVYFLNLKDINLENNFLNSKKFSMKRLNNLERQFVLQNLKV